MNFDNLNEMVYYIEANLENDIDFNELSKITNTNIFILERIFVFLTNMTLNEYIKMRRLSKAFEDLRNTNEKILDIAIKYQYNSASSFNRAFKKLFGISPSTCRKTKDNYKIIPMCYFENNVKNYNFDYKIEKLSKKVLYCYHLSSNSLENLWPKIRELYETTKQSGIYDIFSKSGMYGIALSDDKAYHYYLGSAEKIDGLTEYIIGAGKYAVFTLNSRKQKDIIDLDLRIEKQWFPSTNYKSFSDLKIEYYEGEHCYIYLPIQ